MDDHFLRSRELLQKADKLEARLLAEYAGPSRPQVVGDLQGKLGRCLKHAEVHAMLAVAQRLDVAVLAR